MSNFDDLSALFDDPVRAVLAAYPYHPWRTAFQVSPEEVARRELVLVNQVSEGDGLATVNGTEDQPGGLATLAPRSWESQFYPFALGHVPVIAVAESVKSPRQEYGGLLDWALDQARHDLDVQHLFCRAPAEDIALVHALEGAGFYHVATMLEFAWRRDETRDAPAVSWPLRPATGDDWPAIETLARATMTEIPTRYTADPHLPLAGTQELYAAWAAESLRGNFADVVLVITEGEAVAGFICGRFDPRLGEVLGGPAGDMTIGGVEPGHRQRGAFLSLVQGLLNWFWEHGAQTVITRTQLTNYGSQRTLFRCHGRIVSTHHCFHCWLPSIYDRRSKTLVIL
ncbi:MAG: GNAT family N-acetyltransferase [Chloroflexi bacterium]|nr:GNAT family N-acetyltransferase [Chloroflexota bacterium]MCI0579119.1 GNAT family N-acetyltransferase [Chloroflexota bacterium]MCI0643336.1 GNAT family N-acetyltransferase [Chloroflexota bacterium]MCI0728315.1 GNAT family N-acetyltransferase [Chloroflexota bacterium]